MKLPRHNAELIISHNAHKANYESVYEYTKDFCFDGWISDEERFKAMKSDSVWTVQWYPDTPIGFMVVHASSLEAALSEACRIQEEDDVTNSGAFQEA